MNIQEQNMPPVVYKKAPTLTLKVCPRDFLREVQNGGQKGLILLNLS